jgi:glycosyltransferase involved in cell wall biosynthesis
MASSHLCYSNKSYSRELDFEKIVMDQMRSDKLPFSELTIIVTAFNAELTIVDTLNSIFTSAQGLFDDGSSIPIENFLQDFKGESRLLIHRSVENIGRAKALNRAITLYDSRFIAIVDADDIVLPIRFQEALKILNSRPEIDCVSGQLRKFGDWGCSTILSEFPTSELAIKKKFARFRNVVGHSGATFRRSWFIQLGGYRTFYRCQDLELFTRGFKDNYFISNELYYFYRTKTKKIGLNYFMEQEFWRDIVIRNSDPASTYQSDLIRTRVSPVTKLRIFSKYLLLRALNRI